MTAPPARLSLILVPGVAGDMDRRAFLAAVAGTSGLAGCTGLSDRLAGDPTPTPTPVTGPPLAEHGYPADICEQGTVDVGIYAIAEPAFAGDWSGVDIEEKYADGGRLADDAVVVGVVRGDRPRAYPLSVLWYHEIINDVAGDMPLLVTYCSICRSGMVAERRVAGEPTVFGVSGQLWRPPRLQTRASEASNRTFAADLGNASEDLRVRNRGNLVMIDEATGSFWSQVLARAICGPREGDTLRIVPSTLTTWDEWQDTHPDTETLLAPPHSTLRER